jgi:hypothetical protein
MLVDVTDAAAVARAFAELGPFDHLVIAAAGTDRGRITELGTAGARIGCVRLDSVGQPPRGLQSLTAPFLSFAVPFGAVMRKT